MSVLLATLVLAEGAVAQQLPAPTGAAASVLADAPPPQLADPAAELLAFTEYERRMSVPVRVGDAGPYDFVIDTGAERTVIARQVAGALGLSAGRAVTVAAMTGSETVATVMIPSLQIDRLKEGGAEIEAPSLERQHLGADGLIGLDSLADHALHIDFETREMRVERGSRGRRGARRDEIVVVGKSLLGRLIVTDARIRGHRISVVLDTGTSVSVGNSALLDLIRDKSAELPPIQLLSVTGNLMQAQYRMIPRFEVGRAEFQSLPIAFADVAPFARLGLDRKPALFLGMDALHLFRQVRIDFANRQVRFLLPRPERLALNHHATRIK